MYFANVDLLCVRQKKNLQNCNFLYFNAIETSQKLHFHARDVLAISATLLSSHRDGFEKIDEFWIFF